MAEIKKDWDVWGYGKDGPKLFHLKEGDKLPDGYVDHPDDVKKDDAKADDKDKKKP